jgi:hypothetical protein
MALPTMNPQAAKVFKQPVMGDTRPTPKPKPQPKPSPKSTGKPNPKVFERPVPGQSLTAEPKGRPYERPPEINDPEEALRYHLTRLNDVESLDTVMLLLQKGVDVKSLTEGIMRGAVSEGIHNIDISLTIAPTVHEFIETVADEVGVSYKTGFEKGEQEEDDKEMALVKSMLAKSKGKAPAPKAAPREEPKQQMEMNLGEPEAAPKGLMARV